MIVGNVDHVIGVDCTEGCETVTHDGEESDQDGVDDVDNVVLSIPERDPADQEKHPDETKSCNQECIEGNEKAQCWQRSQQQVVTGNRTNLRLRMYFPNPFMLRLNLFRRECSICRT